MGTLASNDVATLQGRSEGAVEGFTLVVSLPPARLSPNGTRNRYERARLAKAARDEAALACQVIPPHSRPLWPRGAVVVAVTIVLPPGQRRLDNDSAIALMKHSIDGVQGFVLGSDRQLAWGRVEWDRDPRLRAGMVRLTFTPEEVQP